MAYINKKKIYFAGISKGISERYTEGVIVEDIETTSSFSIYSAGEFLGTYEFVQGMTWGEFVNSSYNPATEVYPSKLFSLPTTSVDGVVYYWHYGGGLSIRLGVGSTQVRANDTITPYYDYNIATMHSGGSGN